MASRFALAIVAAASLAGCNSYNRPNDLGTPHGYEVYAAQHEVPVRAVVRASSANCWLDLYFRDGSKLFVADIDLRICTMPEAK